MWRRAVFSESEADRAVIRRQRLTYIAMISAAAILSFIGGRTGTRLDATTLRPAVLTVLHLRDAVEGAARPRRALEQSYEEERAARMLVENELARTRRELEPLWRAFSIAPPSAPRWKMARAIGVLPSSTRQHFGIELGTIDGVFPGASVLAATSHGIAFVGRVVEVSEHSSQVLALTDPSSSIPVRIPSRGSGILFQGGFPRPLGRLLHIPEAADPPAQGAEVRLLDFTPGGGALVGWIHSIEPSQAGNMTGFFTDIAVLPTVDPASLRFVWTEVRAG